LYNVAWPMTHGEKIAEGARKSANADDTYGGSFL
jgi:hypothetical protein